MYGFYVATKSLVTKTGYGEAIAPFTLKQSIDIAVAILFRT